jgi:hypothetical protein
VDELARAMEGSLTYQGDTIVLSIPQTQKSFPTNSTPSPAKVKGALSYYFNDNYGSKPDVGAEVWLIEGDIGEIPGNVFVAGGEKALVMVEIPNNPSVSPRKLTVINHTMADGSGNFEFPNVPPGTYTLVMKSRHVKGPGRAGPFTTRDALGRIVWLVKTVAAGQTVDASFDFGTSTLWGKMTLMYSNRILEVASTEIEEQLQSMPRRFRSDDFYSAFKSNYPRQYETIIRMYVARGHDRPHAIQIAHSQLMHTVNNQFDHLVRKISDCPNPKGGRMSLWASV